jgi:putative effector of murein hydrolase
MTPASVICLNNDTGAMVSIAVTIAGIMTVMTVDGATD